MTLRAYRVTFFAQGVYRAQRYTVHASDERHAEQLGRYRYLQELPTLPRCADMRPAGVRVEELPSGPRNERATVVLRAGKPISTH